MKSVQTYSSAKAFRQALEARLLQQARAHGLAVDRLRKQVAFDRFLARLFPAASQTAGLILKGGYALELRFQYARATKDIDFTLQAGLLRANGEELPDTLLKHIRQFSTQPIADFFEFLITPSVLDLDGAPEGGFRFPVDANMDGRLFARFHVDVGMGDPADPPLETLAGPNWLEFAGFDCPTFLAVSREQQWAEKLHAYSRPRAARANSRTKDLVDLVLLIRSGGLSVNRIRRCLINTFTVRAAHALPEILEAPPAVWKTVFARLAVEAGLDTDMAQSFSVLTGFWRLIHEEDDTERIEIGRLVLEPFPSEDLPDFDRQTFG